MNSNVTICKKDLCVTLKNNPAKIVNTIIVASVFVASVSLIAKLLNSLES